ncbi:MAG: hypothetical protein KAW09_12290 [Thermoplasmata archaeon]|nr:hypothetical protein [Thermoplasmata archaeon]
MPRLGDDVTNGKGSSEPCEDGEHDWADVGVLDENHQDDVDDDIKVYDKTVILQRCMRCGRKRVIEVDTEKDVSLELDGLMLEWVESHPELQRW